MTAGDYRPALFTMVGILTVGLVANLLIRPVDSRHTDVEAARTAQAHADDRARASTTGAQTGAATTSPVLLTLAWLAVGLPLAYGLWFTVERASKLVLG